jgi:hypothetical protein
MPKNFVVDVGEEAKQLALVKAAEAQRRLGRRVTLQKTVETAIKLLDVEAFVKYLEEEEKK